MTGGVDQKKPILDSKPRSPYYNEPDPTKKVEYKEFEPKDIYTLLDTRARDYRTILIAIMAGEIALLVQLVNSVYDKRTIAIIIYGLIMIALYLVASLTIAPEVREVTKQALDIRKNHIINRNAVPNVDTLLIGSKGAWIGKLFWVPLVVRNEYLKITKEDETSPDRPIR